MNIRRILISEQEKKDILSQYNLNTNIISEQTLNSDGTYTTKNTYKFIPTADPSPNPKFNPTFKAGTKIWTNFDKPDEDKIYFGTTDYYLTCSFQGYDYVIQYKEGDTLKENNLKPVLTTAIRKLFCNGKQGKKTWNEAVGKTTNSDTKKTNSRCKFIEKEFTNQQVCFIPNDNTWMYAKTDDGKWYTTKQIDKKTWCELTTPKYQKAVDKLNIECKGITPIPKLELKPISPIDTENKLELSKTPEQKLKDAEEAAKKIQDFQNRPQ